ncbi:hypothetical protein F4779DRAFT_339455 [Xylariaceae sp. FL0662B]|nr:hypothetical protein F4779DRAFT_339455 [Xylariaceae sp. FL0662B]
MHAPSVISIITLAAAVSAAIDHSHDGIYKAKGKVASIGKRGLEVLPRTEPMPEGFLTVKRSAAASGDDESLEARNEYKGIGCDSGIATNPDFGPDAQKALKDYCANSGDCKESIWAKVGDSVVFFCRWRDSSKFDAGSLDHAISMIEDQCGNNQSGSYSNDKESKRSYSYGWTSWERHGWCNYPTGYEF